MEFRAIKPADYEAVRQFLAENGWENRISDVERFRKMMKNANRTVVAFDGERIVGFARALCDDVSNGYIGTVAVAEDKRGQGVGRELVERLIGDDANITWVLRAGRGGSEKFWEKMGFSASAVAMEKTRSEKQFFMKKSLSIFLVFSFWVLSVHAQTKPRARDLGIPFDGATGQFNAITDVKGIEVGYSTLISGDGKTAVRTGVTAIFPQGKDFKGRVFAAWHTLNGNGEMTGTTWVEESGGLGTPVLITNTHSVGIVRDAVIEWNARRGASAGYSGDFSLPVVAETWDGFLNDINGFHVKKENVFEALNSAKSGAILEGNVGGGTGMVTHRFKGGTGTSSRVLEARFGGYTVGVLVQANYGARQLFSVAGVPVGKEITDLLPTQGSQTASLSPLERKFGDAGQGSIIVVVATDAPLLPHQLKRLTQRVSLGIGNVGGRGENSSGDIFIAFSTANAGEASKDEGVSNLTMLPNERINPLFWATAQATEEAIINALIAAETMKGINGNTVYALPHDRLKEVLKKYNRLQEAGK